MTEAHVGGLTCWYVGNVSFSSFSMRSVRRLRRPTASPAKGESVKATLGKEVASISESDNTATLGELPSSSNVEIAEYKNQCSTA